MLLVFSLSLVQVLTIYTNYYTVSDKHLESASVILLLISSDFIASDYCYSAEMTSALKRHEAGTAIVIPILLRPVNWEQTLFAHLRFLPYNGKPVTKWRNQDEAFLDITQGILEAIESFTFNSSIEQDSEKVVNDDMDMIQKPHSEGQKSSIDSYEAYDPYQNRKMRLFVQQQDKFDLALVRAVPGKGNYTYIQATNKKIIDRVLSSLADTCESCDLWWFIGHLNSPACPIKKISQEVWLIEYTECKIIDLWIFRHPTQERQYVFLHLAAQPPFGIYDTDHTNIGWEEAGYYEGRYVTRSEYDDGYAEIDGEIIELSNPELRVRNLKDDFMVIVPKYSVYNQMDNDEQTAKVSLGNNLTIERRWSILQA